jgi:hypothetical protein
VLKAFKIILINVCITVYPPLGNFLGDTAILSLVGEQSQWIYLLLYIPVWTPCKRAQGLAWGRRDSKRREYIRLTWHYQLNTCQIPQRTWLYPRRVLSQIRTRCAVLTLVALVLRVMISGTSSELPAASVYLPGTVPRFHWVGAQMKVACFFTYHLFNPLIKIACIPLKWVVMYLPVTETACWNGPIHNQAFQNRVDHYLWSRKNQAQPCIRSISCDLSVGSNTPPLLGTKLNSACSIIWFERTGFLSAQLHS